MRHLATLSPDIASQIGAGKNDALIFGMACLASYWMQLGGYRLSERKQVGMASIAAAHPEDSPQSTPEQRAFLAAGCDLYDLLALHPQGRQALRNLLSNPIPKEPKGE